MVAAVTGCFFLVPSKKRGWAFLAALPVVGMIFFWRARVFQSLDANPTYWDRVKIWMDSLKVWAKDPWWGVGPGAFAGLYHQVKTPRDNGVSRFLMDAQFSHNEFLEFLTAFGLVGSVILLILLVDVWSRKPKAQGPALLALGAASFVDFYLHTPLILLQGVGLLGEGQGKKEKGSWLSAFLVGGVALGLFGSAAWAQRGLMQAEELAAQDRLPQALRYFEAAERSNAWDDRYAAAKAEFLEKLYRATRDPSWGSRADGAYQRAMDLEASEGQWALKNAERLTGRLDQRPSPVDIQKAQEAWERTRGSLPFNVFARYEEGLFFLRKGDKTTALLAFERAAQLEPNFAVAWVRAGWLLKEKKEKSEALYCFRMAWEVHERWKDALRIDPLEEDMISLTPEVLGALAKELKHAR
jgi:tetratricopeptide (TPR) repeat protein